MMMLRYIDLMDNPLIDSNPGEQAHVQVSDVASDEFDSLLGGALVCQSKADAV